MPSRRHRTSKLGNDPAVNRAADLAPPMLLRGDCLDEMRRIPAGSIDLIVADLPYATSGRRDPRGWDEPIPFEPLWEEWRHLLKPTGTVVMTASQPFSTDCILSNRDWFKYALVWVKTRPSGYLHAPNKPMKAHEDVLVFSGGTTVHPHQSQRRMTYHPVGVRKLAKPIMEPPVKTPFLGNDYITRMPKVQTATGYPNSVLAFPSEGKTVHPTQKPLSLIEFLVQAYSNPGENVLDPVMGSGTTGIAAINTGRRFIGIEREPEFFETARDRIHASDRARLVDEIIDLRVKAGPDFETVVRCSRTFTEATDRLGWPRHTKSNERLRRMAEERGIDLSHMVGKAWRAGEHSGR